VRNTPEERYVGEGDALSWGRDYDEVRWVAVRPEAPV
jgi:hypothetical protein